MTLEAEDPGQGPTGLHPMFDVLEGRQNLAKGPRGPDHPEILTSRGSGSWTANEVFGPFQIFQLVKALSPTTFCVHW